MNIKADLRQVAWNEYQMAKNKCDRLESELSDAKQTRDTAWAAYCLLCPTPKEFGCKDAIEDMFQCGALEDGQPTIASSNKGRINGKD